MSEEINKEIEEEQIEEVSLDTEEENEEIETIEEDPFVLKTELGKKDNRYFYYVDGDGNICKKLRRYRKSRRLKTFKGEFTKANLTVPKVTISGWCSNKFKTVRRTGDRGGYIWFPDSLVNKEFMVILIPKEDWIVHQLI